jgi:hypothetical protein
MKFPIDNFEEELRQIHPATPGSCLTERISAELKRLEKRDSTAQKQRWMPLLKRLVWASCAIGLLLISFYSIYTGNPKTTRMNSTQTAPPPPQTNIELPPQFRSLKTDNYLIAAQEDGIVFSHSSTPLRKVKYSVISSSEWFDATEKATVQLLSPREEVVLIPINVY